MIKAITVKTKKDGLYLSAQTKKGKYGQYYNTTEPKKRNFVKDELEARDKFRQFYNQFE